MPEETIIDKIKHLQEAQKRDVALRFMGIVHRAEHYGVEVRLIAYPKDAKSIPVNQFREVGDHLADLTCQLDIVDAYVTGLAWRDVPDQT